jgi:hypothetical protein
VFRYWWDDNAPIVIAALTIVMIIAPIIWLMVQQSLISRQCLRCGWPDYNWVVLTGEKYCVGEVDETEIVVPLEWVIENCGERLSVVL